MEEISNFTKCFKQVETDIPLFSCGKMRSSTFFKKNLRNLTACRVSLTLNRSAIRLSNQLVVEVVVVEVNEVIRKLSAELVVAVVALVLVVVAAVVVAAVVLVVVAVVAVVLVVVAVVLVVVAVVLVIVVVLEVVVVVVAVVDMWKTCQYFLLNSSVVGKKSRVKSPTGWGTCTKFFGVHIDGNKRNGDEAAYNTCVTDQLDIVI